MKMEQLQNIRQQISSLEAQLLLLRQQEKAILAETGDIAHNPLTGSTKETKKENSTAAELPIDILTLIFKALLESTERQPHNLQPNWGWGATNEHQTYPAVPFPFNISWVSSSWRLAALSTFELWSTLSLHINSKPIHPPGPRANRQHYISSILAGEIHLSLHDGRTYTGQAAAQLLDLFLNRTLLLEVELSVIYQPSPWGRSTDSDDEDPTSDNQDLLPPSPLTKSMLKLLLSRASDWLSASISGDFMWVLDTLGLEMEIPPMWTNLNTLHTDGYNHSSAEMQPSRFFVNTPALKQLKMTGVSSHMLDINWLQIETLSLAYVTPQVSHRILCSTSQVKTLGLVFDHWSHGDTSSSPKIHLPKLNHLSLHDTVQNTYILDNLVAPNLTTLQLENSTKVMAVGLEGIQKNMTQLSVCSSIPSCTSSGITMLEVKHCQIYDLPNILQALPDLTSMTILDMPPRSDGGWTSWNNVATHSQNTNWNHLMTLLTTGLLPQAAGPSQPAWAHHYSHEPEPQPALLLVPKLQQLKLAACLHPIDVRVLQKFLTYRTELILPIKFQLEISYSTPMGENKSDMEFVEEQKAALLLREILGTGKAELKVVNAPTRWGAVLDKDMVSIILNEVGSY
uniref:F-box domain-containing protein n=1 Tax=Mycena chlorophos TaxID=658473 RepID=A0ABQ0L2Y1_MYCCL|nr:predicted protein [Mycena chlorophos]